MSWSYPTPSGYISGMSLNFWGSATRSVSAFMPPPRPRTIALRVERRVRAVVDARDDSDFLGVIGTDDGHADVQLAVERHR